MDHEVTIKEIKLSLIRAEHSLNKDRPRDVETHLYEILYFLKKRLPPKGPHAKSKG